MPTAVETVREAFEAWNAADYERWESFYDPDAVVVPPEGWPEAEITRSRGAWRAQADRLRDSWEHERIEVEEHREVGEDVLSTFRWVTRGKGSGLDLETPMACATRVRDGAIVHQRYTIGDDAARQLGFDA
jgi:ketosteroid isomerase-like protein